jgi:Right handed beta helix region/RTX calcium-binding nonapeptide repeat (4 copies)
MQRKAATGIGLAAALAAPASAQAGSSIEVTTFNDDAPTSLREAINVANSNPDFTTITFASTLSGDYDVFGSALPAITEPLEIVGPGAGVIAVDGQDTYRIFNVNLSSGEDFKLSGLTLKEGSAAGRGGAILSSNGDVTLEDAVLSSNEATDGGGGITAINGTLSISGTTITDGSALFGGGIYVDDASLTIADSTVSGNTIGPASGGGIYAYYGPGAITITDTVISGNTAGDGGGAHIKNRTAPITITGSEIYDNTANGAAAGLFVEIGDGAPLNVSNTTISDNHAAGFGGGVRIHPESTTDRATFTGTTIVKNSADRGGGVYATPPGGNADPLLRNTIVADNTATLEGNDLYGSFDAAFSLIESTSGATISETVAGSNVTGQDPQLGALADNGGPTRTHAITQSSPAADVGRAFGLTSDQRGESRPSDFLGIPNSTAAGADGSDIGAFELQAPPIPGGKTCAGRKATIVAKPGKRTVGTNGPDVIAGTGKRDRIKGRGGKDVICGLAGNDVLRGGGGKDRLLGGKGRDLLIGGPGKDVLRGGPGRDRQRQ